MVGHVQGLDEELAGRFAPDFLAGGADFGGGLRQVLFASGAQGDVGALARQFQGHGPAESPAARGDQRGFSAQLEIH